MRAHSLRRFAPLASIAALAVALCACTGTQDTGPSGEVQVTVRRIDVLKADFSAMKVAVVLAVENGTSADVEVSADGSIAILGEAKDAEGGEGASDAAPALAGERHSGRGKGVAGAHNTSELLIPIDLPLPSDPALLDTVLGWQKMAVQIEGSARVGTKEFPIGGQRELAPPHLPEVKLKEAQVASENDGQSGAGFFTVLLDNKNPFPVTVDKLSFTISIKDKVLQPNTGNTEVTSDEVPGSAVAEYQVEVLINEAAFGKDLRALLKQPTVPYVVEGTVNVRGIEKPFKFSGDMKFAR